MLHKVVAWRVGIGSVRFGLAVWVQEVRIDNSPEPTNDLGRGQRDRQQHQKADAGVKMRWWQKGIERPGDARADRVREDLRKARRPAHAADFTAIGRKPHRRIAAWQPYVILPPRPDGLQVGASENLDAANFVSYGAVKPGSWRGPYVDEL